MARAPDAAGSSSKGAPDRDREDAVAASAERALQAAHRRLWDASLPTPEDGTTAGEPSRLRPAPRERRAKQRRPRVRPASSANIATVAQLGADLRAGRVSALRLAEQALGRAASARDRFGAFVTLTEDVALDAAARADRELAAGRDRGPLHGIPVAVKDVIDVSGIPTANGTAGLGWRLPQRDALAWATLRRAGAVLVGKTTTHELAWGATTPQCRNPIDITRVAGGSSGGSAVAVASGVVPVALGTDTGGSARLPAALCGTVGFRPATGSAPMPGITPLAPSQDTLGVLAASVADCELVATLLSRRRQTSARGATERFGVFDDEWASRTAPGVSAAFAGARMRLAEIGIEAEQVRLPMAALAPAASYVTMLSESARLWWPAARVHAEAIGDEVRALLRVGAGVTETDLARARDVSRAIRTGLSAAMKNASVDVCVLPTAPVTAHPLDATCAEINGREVPIEAAYVSFTALASVTGLAALSVPCGADENDLPVGLQVIAAPGREAAMWSFARRIEEISTAG